MSILIGSLVAMFISGPTLALESIFLGSVLVVWGIVAVLRKWALRKDNEHLHG
jgi:hypothetical protein